MLLPLRIIMHVNLYFLFFEIKRPNQKCMQSAIVYQSELPMNMMIRWAFGGFSYHEFSSRIKSFMNRPQQTKDLFNLFKFFFSTSRFLFVLKFFLMIAFVSFIHEHSHTNMPTCESRGNAIADYYADELRENQRKYMNVMPQFDLRLGERSVCLRDSTFHSVVSGDIRTAARDHFRLLSLWEWMRSESQGAFAHEGVGDLCKYVFKQATRKQRAVFILVVTNIIHKKRVTAISISSSSSSLSSSSSSSSSSSLSLLSSSLSSSSSQRRYDVIDATCSSCHVVMNVGHLLLFCSSFQKQRQEVTQQLCDALCSHLKQQRFSVHSMSLSLNDLSFHQLLFLLISLPPSFSIVNRHPLVLQQINCLCECCSSSNHHACESLLSYDHDSFLRNQTSKSKVYGQSAIVYQSELPMNMMIRWAFGGFSYHEFSSRIKSFMNQSSTN